MKISLRVVALFASLTLLPVVAVATDDAPQPVQPTEPAPTWLPPPPTEIDVTSGQEVVVQQVAPAGQWVFTSQYGWVWMPHGNSFTFLPSNGAPPNMFVFYPAVGWSWVVAPWVWGWGTMPWFGFAGWGGYPWYGSGFGRWHGFARPFAHAGWNSGRYWQGGRWNGVGPGFRPPPPRPGVGAQNRPGFGAANRPGGAVHPGPRAGGAPPPRTGPGAPPRVVSASPGRPAVAPGRTYATPVRPVGAPSSYSPGRGFAPQSRTFTSGGQNFAPRGYASAAPHGGYRGGNGGGFAGGGGASRGGSGGGSGGGGGHGGGRR
jgi:hypothetical protein